MLLFLKHSFPLLGQLSHGIKQSKVLRGSSPVNPKRLSSPPADGRLRLSVGALLLLLLLLLLLGSLLLGQNSALGSLKPLVVSSEVLGFGHICRKTFKSYPSLKTFPRSASLGARGEE
jgi:hypothetical protein